MILDSSAVIAVLHREKHSRRLEVAMEAADELAIGAPTLLETSMVAIGRSGLPGRHLVDRFLEDWEVRVSPFGERHCRVASDAFVRYGKGARHPAKLNYGDCMTYATARLAAAPLLFTGKDFAMTDIAAA